MRNNLSELPVLLCCIWGGALAGLAVFLLRLPKKLYESHHRGLRTPFFIKLLLGILDMLTCAAAALIFVFALVYANGGELRAYAVLGYSACLALNVRLLGALLL